MKTILLAGNSGKIITVDDGDYESVSRFKWYEKKGKKNIYAYTTLTMGRISGKLKCASIGLHQLIMRPPKGMDVDHRNHNGLDCRRENMRICTRSQNIAHSRKKTGSSRFKGVFWVEVLRKWRSRIKVNYKGIHLGVFIDEVKAARAYDKAALEYFGEFAYTNFPLENYS
jgi:hypothetical protein